MENLSLELQPYEQNIYDFAAIVEKIWPGWDYHNFGEHGVETVYVFLDQVNYARDNGIEISTETVVAGILSSLEHDLANDWGNPYLADYFEDRSATIGTGIAQSLGIGSSILKQKYEATLATRPGSKCHSLLDIMVRRADIANLAWEYDLFKEKTIKYWREIQAQCAEKMTFSQWVCSDMTKQKVMDLLDEDLALGDFDRDPETGQSFFHTDVFANFQTLHDEINSPNFVEPELLDHKV